MLPWHSTMNYQRREENTNLRSFKITVALCSAHKYVGTKTKRKTQQDPFKSVFVVISFEVINGYEGHGALMSNGFQRKTVLSPISLE